MDLDVAYEMFVYLIPEEKFVYKLEGRWQINTPVRRDGIRNFLTDAGLDRETVKGILEEESYVKVHGVDMVPGQPEMFTTATGHRYLNTWVAPTLKPKPHPHPTIDTIIDWLTGHDPEGVRWLTHWMAYKVQNPAAVPKVAVVLSTGQGAGKNILASIMFEALGLENTAKIERSALESRFNARWVDKLFVFADEVMTSENVKDVSDKLKIYIDGNEVELEGKGTNQRAIRSRMAWLFASNDIVTPVTVERGDRRYTVFANHEPVTPEYSAMLASCYNPSARHQRTPEFEAEVAGFIHTLKNVQVDGAFIKKPYENHARKALISASDPMHEHFMHEINRNGIDPLLEEWLETPSDWAMTRNRDTWDFGERGLAVNIIYEIYKRFCKSDGGRPLKKGKLVKAMVERGFKAYNPLTPDKSRQVPCLVVPRKKQHEVAA